MKSVLAAGLAAAALGLAALGGTALAQAAAAPTASPDGSFTIQKPTSWPAKMDTMSKAGSAVTEYVSGTANEECYFDVIPRAETAASTPTAVIKAWTTPLTPELWATAFKDQYLLRDGPATVESSSVDTSHTFPAQVAVLKNSKNRVVAAIHARPGVEIWVACTAYDGKDHDAVFKQVAASVVTAKDAEYKATIDGAAAAAAAAAEAAAAAKAKPKGK
jgi:hypothetical protein